MSTHDYAAMRRAMVESQLRTSDVNDPAITAAMARVPRERFVPEAYHSVAYMDRAVPLGDGRALSPPVSLGLLLQALLPLEGAHTLVLGAAVGYAAAVLRELGAGVVALEEASGPRPSDRSDSGVTMVAGPLVAGAADHGPYDRILIDGAIEHLPDAIVAQLADDGLVAAGLLRDGVTTLSLGTRHGAGFGWRPLADSELPALPGFARPQGFRFG